MKKEELTEEQKKAVEHFKGPELIIAGPGAGKTWVLIEKIYYLIEKKGVHPDNILITTFTVKAAEEIKSRIVKKIGAKAQAMQISTIHSLCQTILESYPDHHNLGGTFEVLDEEMQYLFVRINFYRLGLKDLIKNYQMQKLIAYFNILTENLIDPKQLIKRYEKIYPNNEEYVKLCQSYQKYLELLKQDYKIDFAGLQNETLNLLKNDRLVLNGVKNKYRFILVDEYQDTNPIQAEIFKIIAGKKSNICVVGDEDQSIYGFRGANVDNFRNFTKVYPGAEVIHLQTNFRSKNQIVSFSDSFIKKHRTFPKKLKPIRGRGNEIILVKGKNAQDEAERVIDIIEKMKSKNMVSHYGYIALLFKSVNFHAKPFISKLKERGISYEVRGSGGFLDREEIRTILYLMAYVDPPDYEGKFSRKWGSWWNLAMFKTDLLKLTKNTIKILEDLPKDFDLSLLLNKKDFVKKRISDIEDIDKLKTLNYLKKELDEREKGVLEIFYEVIKRTKYFNRLFKKNSEENKSKLYNLARLTQIINKYEGLKRRSTVEDFLWYIYTLPRDLDEKVLENPYAVKVTTIHQAKGLEFPVVFVCSVMKGRFPRVRSEEETIAPIPEDLLLAKSNRGIEEERRLFYVGMTRAKDFLIISTADKVISRGGGASSFLTEEIGLDKFKTPEKIVECCEEHEIETSKPVKLSYSSLSNYEECPFRFELFYIYSFQSPAGFFQNRGIIIHNALHRLHTAMKKGEKIDFDKVKKIVELSWIRMSHKKKKDQEMKEKLQTQLFYQYYKIMKDYIKEIIVTEKPFTLVFDEFIIAGRVDLIIKNKYNEIELIDFKAMDEKGIEQTNVELQLRIYEYALENEFKINKLSAYTFLDNKKTYFKTNKEILKDVGKELNTIITGIRKEDFNPKKNPFCGKCPFKFTCKLFGG